MNALLLNDARMLAKIARLDPQLLHPIGHGTKEAQRDLLQVIDMMTQKIRAVEALRETKYPATQRLRQIVGIGPFAPDTDLKRHGLMLAERGGGRGTRGKPWWPWPASSPC